MPTKVSGGHHEPPCWLVQEFDPKLLPANSGRSRTTSHSPTWTLTSSPTPSTETASSGVSETTSVRSPKRASQAAERPGQTRRSTIPCRISVPAALCSEKRMSDVRSCDRTQPNATAGGNTRHLIDRIAQSSGKAGWANSKASSEPRGANDKEESIGELMSRHASTRCARASIEKPRRRMNPATPRHRARSPRRVSTFPNGIAARAR